jgi:hypothetical protein
MLPSGSSVYRISNELSRIGWCSRRRVTRCLSFQISYMGTSADSLYESPWSGLSHPIAHKPAAGHADESAPHTPVQAATGSQYSRSESIRMMG